MVVEVPEICPSPTTAPASLPNYDFLQNRHWILTVGFGGKWLASRYTNPNFDALISLLQLRISEIRSLINYSSDPAHTNTSQNVQNAGDHEHCTSELIGDTHLAHGKG